MKRASSRLQDLQFAPEIGSTKKVKVIFLFLNIGTKTGLEKLFSDE